MPLEPLLTAGPGYARRHRRWDQRGVVYVVHRHHLPSDPGGVSSPRLPSFSQDGSGEWLSLSLAWRVPTRALHTEALVTESSTTGISRDMPPDDGSICRHMRSRRFVAAQDDACASVAHDCARQLLWSTRARKLTWAEGAMEMSGLSRRWACRGSISNLQSYAACAAAVNKLDRDTLHTCTNALNGPLSRAESETAVMEKFTACRPKGLEWPLQTPAIKLQFFIKTDTSFSSGVH